KTEMEFNDVNNILKTAIVGSVTIDEKPPILKSKNIDRNFKIVTSDGRVIQVDQNGRYHLTVNKFNGIDEKETLVLKLIVPKMYNKNSLRGEKLKLLNVRAGNFIKQDFNLYTGGKLNG
ncbi:MAG: hypothetical protein ACOC1K_07460, partial [Nanoarchaeota archaeon]